MDDEEIIWDRLVFAMPELKFNDDYVQVGVDNGWITAEEGAAWKRANRTAKRVKRTFKKASMGTPLQRIMAVMPEIMSTRTIDFLRKVEIGGAPLLGVTEANAMRAALAGAKKLRPTFAPEATILQRVEGVFDAATSSSVINLIRDIDTERIARLRQFFLLRKDYQDEVDAGVRFMSRSELNAFVWNALDDGVTPSRSALRGDEAAVLRRLLDTSIRRAQQMRSLVSSGKLVYDAAQIAREQRTVWGAVTVVADHVIGYKGGDRMLKNAIRAGVISQQDYSLIRSLEKIGFDMWRKVIHAKRYESWAARTLILSEGILSDSMIRAINEFVPIPKTLRSRLFKISHHIRDITREEFQEYMKSARFRIVPGESPIKTFARISRYTDSEVLRLLRDAAADTHKDIARLAGQPGFGSLTRARQQRSLLAGINTKMRELWEDVGTLTIFGEKEAAQAAWISEEAMFATYKAAGQNADLRALRTSMRAGLDNFISREENLVELSSRVYKNAPLSYGIVEREVQKGLIRGLSAKELAANVASLIQPDTPGGVSYAAMRLSRTEINNAFHFSQIRYTREMPWVEGYKWNLSGSHPTGRPDICNDMSEENHDSIGPGVYKKANVPAKPHPHCLCFITNVLMDNATFERRLRSGAFNQYIDAQINKNTISFKQAGDAETAFASYIKDAARTNARATGASAAIAAWSGAKSVFSPSP